MKSTSVIKKKENLILSSCQGSESTSWNEGKGKKLKTGQNVNFSGMRSGGKTISPHQLLSQVTPCRTGRKVDIASLSHQESHRRRQHRQDQSAGLHYPRPSRPAAGLIHREAPGPPKTLSSPPPPARLPEGAGHSAGCNQRSNSYRVKLFGTKAEILMAPAGEPESCDS